jgi:beta-aspartyl-peptidase (threonine type)
VVVVHAGAGARSPELMQRQDAVRGALLETIDIARAVLDGGGSALEAAQSAVMHMEDVEFFNAGRGAALCADGSVELSAAVMRGADRAAGAVAAVKATRHPILAARAVLEHGAHVLLVGAAADGHAAAAGAEQVTPEYFVTERQQHRLMERGSDFDRGTVGTVCLDAEGVLAAATSTGGRRGQLPGRVGDSPQIGAGTWADERVAVSCTGDGEAFIRAGVARHIGALVAAGSDLESAARRALAEVAALAGTGGLIAVERTGAVAMPFNSEAMPRGMWRAGDEPATWV